MKKHNISKKIYTEDEAFQIWKAGQEYWKTSGGSITYEELTERMGKKKNNKMYLLKKTDS